MNSEQCWYVYILVCRDQTLYTGSTPDVEKRLAKHNAGQGAKYTAARKPVQLIYSENCASKSEALKRELQIKKLSRAEKLNLIQLNTNLTQAFSSDQA